MRTLKQIVLKAKLFLAETNEDDLVEIYKAGYRQACEDFKKEQKEKKKEEPLPVKIVTEPFIPSFIDFWNLYGKKRERGKCEALWNKLKAPEKMAIMEHVPRYVDSTPDVQFRKDPARYLRNRCWEDQIIPNNGNANEQERDFFTGQAELFARLNSTRKPNP